MGGKETAPFQFTFNGFLKVAFQASRVTSDAGLILVRELDDRLGLQVMITVHLRDTRQGLNTQFRLPDFLRQSVYGRLAGYADLNDAARLSTDPTFRLIGAPTRWDRSAALTSTLHWFETERLTHEDNLVGLMAVRAAHFGQMRLPQRANAVFRTGSARVSCEVTRTGLTWARSTFRTDARRSVLFDTSTKPDTPVSWGAARAHGRAGARSDHIPPPPLAEDGINNLACLLVHWPDLVLPFLGRHSARSLTPILA